MGTVITVMNMKGGVGKTTVTLHLGGLTGRFEVEGRRRKVLLIDYDPQFNLSQAFIAPRDYFPLETNRKTTLSVLIEDETKLDPFRIQTPGNEKPPSVTDLRHKLYSSSFPPQSNSQLDIIPSTLDLMYVALGDLDKKAKTIEERFTKFIEECRSIYDLIFIDCHPAGSIFTRTSLRNSDHVLIPVIPQKYAVRGIGLMLQFIEKKSLGVTGPKPHILFNATGRTGVSPDEAAIRSNKDFKNLCLTRTLKRFKAFSEPEDGKGFVWFSKKPYSTAAYSNLYYVAKELLERIEK